MSRTIFSARFLGTLRHGFSCWVSKLAILLSQSKGHPKFMTRRLLVRLSFLLLVGFTAWNIAFAANSWMGQVFSADGKPVANATVRLHAASGARDYEAKTSATGEFRFESIEPGAYSLSVALDDKTWRLAAPFSVTDGALLNSSLVLSGQDQTLRLRAALV